jgi:hypothetical protein
LTVVDGDSIDARRPSHVLLCVWHEGITKTYTFIASGRIDWRVCNGVNARQLRSEHRIGGTCYRNVYALGVKLNLWTDVEGIPIPPHNGLALWKEIRQVYSHITVLLTSTVRKVCDFEILLIDQIFVNII